MDYFFFKLFALFNALLQVREMLPLKQKYHHEKVEHALLVIVSIQLPMIIVPKN